MGTLPVATIPPRHIECVDFFWFVHKVPPKRETEP
jgi:hypothetical protein